MRRPDHDTLRRWLKVYFVMGSTNCNRNPADVLSEAIEGGITLFQYREKGKGSLQGESRSALAAQLLELCKQNAIPFIVNDDVELAVALDADGVHIGQEDEPVEQVRRKIGDKILGVSVHTYEEALSAIRGGADYLGLGPIFATRTKEDAGAAEGVTLIRDLRKSGLTIPIAGIGGITAENAAVVMRAGADGVAVVTAISQAEFIAKHTMLLKRIVLS